MTQVLDVEPQALVAGAVTDPAEEELTAWLRPKTLAEFIGQDDSKPVLDEAMRAAKKNGHILDHVLISGPAGLGKTTIAKIIASQMGGNLVQTHGTVLKTSADMMAILTKLEKGDVLFIDEIHRVPRDLQDYLLTAMEDFTISFIYNKGDASAQAIQVPIQPFTMIGATTRKGMLDAAMLSRFGLDFAFDFYDLDSLTQIAVRSARLMGMTVSAEAAKDLAGRSRGTPRIVNRLLRRVRDYCVVRDTIEASTAFVDASLSMQKIDRHGLTPLDRSYLAVLLGSAQTVGLKSIAATMQQEVATLEDTVEPYLLHSGFIRRLPTGRRITQQGINAIR